MWTKRYENKVLVQNLSKKLKGEHLSDRQIQMLITRGLKNEKDIKTYLHGNMSDLHNPFLMKDMSSAVNLIIQAVFCQQKIGIFGDYDADGVCATTIMYKALKNIGADVCCYIPDRFTEGYGMNINAIKKLVDQKVDLIISVDNGITAKEQVQYALDNFVDIIITDHHSVQEDKIPLNVPVINPHQEDCEYPYKDLCGAGVAWKVMQSVYTTLFNDFNYEADFNVIEQLLSFVAVATVADMVPLTGENRILVKEGLKQLNLNNGYKDVNKGLIALMNVMEVKTITAEEIGFKIGPCINAAGRLKHAKEALKCFIEDNVSASVMELKNLNEERKKLTEDFTKKAFEVIEAENLQDDKFMLVFVEGIPEGIVGLIASQVKEKYQVPTMVFTEGADHFKASGRGVEGHPLSLFEALMNTKEYWVKGGGHAMACGISIIKDMDNLTAFRKKLNELTEKYLAGNDFSPELKYDFSIDNIDPNLIEEISIFEPTGMNNPTPVFLMNGLKVQDTKLLGIGQNHLKIIFDTGLQGLAFGMGQKFVAEQPTKIKILCTPYINEYEQKDADGNTLFVRKTLQVNILDYQKEDYRDRSLLISSLRTF